MLRRLSPAAGATRGAPGPEGTQNGGEGGLRGDSLRTRTGRGPIMAAAAAAGPGARSRGEASRAELARPATTAYPEGRPAAPNRCLRGGPDVQSEGGSEQEAGLAPPVPTPRGSQKVRLRSNRAGSALGGAGRQCACAGCRAREHGWKMGPTVRAHAPGEEVYGMGALPRGMLGVIVFEGLVSESENH